MALIDYRKLCPRSGHVLTRDERNAKVIEASVHWNYTTVLNVVSLTLAAVLLWRFVRTGGLPMLRMMNAPTEGHAHVHHHHA